MIVIATEGHRAAVAAALRAAGADLDALRARGTFIERDAAATLAAFRRDGSIVPAEFDALVGGLVRDAAGSGLPVLAFGEMVALLWKAGEVVAAIELETLWNELGRRRPSRSSAAIPTRPSTTPATSTRCIGSVTSCTRR
jgi:hypothetical protein